MAVVRSRHLMIDWDAGLRSCMHFPQLLKLNLWNRYLLNMWPHHGSGPQVWIVEVQHVIQIDVGIEQ